jgi:EAL domain-containing protein (putative c-di-GMP-specific phosphodiesterase class I)
MLILDDDAAVGQTIEWIAESLGFEAAFVTRSQDFFDKLIQMDPEFITIDLIMPEFDGVEIMRSLAERMSRAKIIISSGMGTRVLDAAHRSALEHGLCIAGVISKPISIEALRKIVGEGTEQDETVSKEERFAECNRFEITKSDLEDAVERNEFEVVYQPKIDCKSGSPAGFEALARWRHRNKRIIMPDQFIPIAEENGLIDALTAQIVEQSMEWFSRAFPESKLMLSLNISAKSLVGIQLADSLSAICNRFRLAPERIALELTETGAMVDPILSLDLMTRFRVKGFHLAIDDFGTGFSSMVQLVRLPFSEIKVDKSFVIQARQSQESRSVIKSIIDLGHSLGLVVTAEGIEDLWTLDYVRSLGCDFAQGHFIARPISGEAACEWVGQMREAPGVP